MRFLAMAVVGTGLFLATQELLSVPCGGLFVMVALVAWPIWHYQQENALFQRRAMLSAVSAEQGRLRRLFWAGSFTRIIQVFVALAWSLLLLGFASLLAPIHWWILGADTVLLSLLVVFMYRSLASEVRPDQVGLVARRWLLPLVNVVILTVAFLVVDFTSGVPDTRGMAWHVVAENAFADRADGADCVLSGWMVGTFAAVEQLAWHASEILIPSLPNQETKLVAWAIFLIQAGAVAYGFTRLMLGIVCAVEARHLRVSSFAGESTFSQVFILTILLLAGPYIYLMGKLDGFDLSKLPRGVGLVIEVTDPCRAVTPEVTALETGLNDQLDQTAATARAEANQQIDASLDRIFADVESGVEGYLDWYFTVIGEYERLAAVATGDAADFMAAELKRHLFELTEYAKRIEHADAEVTQNTLVTMMKAAEEAGKRVRFEVEDSPCKASALNLSVFESLERDKFRASGAASSGVAAGALTAKALANKAAAAVPAKVASKKGFQAGASLLGKAAAKKGGTALLGVLGGAAACSPGGPIAALCGIVAGVTTWLLVDKAFIEIDEALFRNEMREEILASVREHRTLLSETLKQRQHERIDNTAKSIQSSVDRLFVPFRDGV